MRDRLSKMIQDSVGGCAKHWADTIADYLLANGVIVPPCKVGDTVYMLAIWYKEVHTYMVSEINIGAGNNNIVVLDQYDGGFVSRRAQAVYFNQFDKTVFFTREEAEKALAERSENEHRTDN